MTDLQARILQFTTAGFPLTDQEAYLSKKRAAAAEPLQVLFCLICQLMFFDVLFVF